MATYQMYNNIQLFIFISSLVVVTARANPYASGDWLNHGGDIYNRRYAIDETKINPLTASKLHLKWEFYAGRDITATPAIFDDTLYFPAWNGYLYAVKACNGSLLWKKNLQELTRLVPTVLVYNTTWIVSRATPTIADDDKIIVAIYGPAIVIAVNRFNGELLWSTKLDTHPSSVITMSGTYHNGYFYVGTSSLEEITATLENCCTFQGSFYKLDAKTGDVVWQTFMVPENHGRIGGYSGAAIWGSSPSIDIRRKHVYIATGNLYSVPPHIEECQEKQNNNQSIPTGSGSDMCIEPDNHSNSILALELDSGKIEWYRQLGGYDVWFVACINSSTPNCPPGPNPDADFGEAPMMLSIYVTGTRRDIVVAVQKSGFAWALDRDDGKIVWSTEAGPGGTFGGGTWGAATEGKRVYTSIVNSDQLNFTLLPSKNVTNGGGWVAMDARTGKILWSTAIPDNAGSNPVTLANGVIFAGSTYPTGPVYAIDAKTGEIIWSYETGATIYGGVSVSKGCVYVGNGYRINAGLIVPSFTAGTSLFAFCLE